MYLVVFYNKGKKICSCWKDGKNKEDAMLKAEFSLMCKYSNVEYDEVKTEN